ncbi:MAG: hypothetical protein IIB02_08625 [Thaumarchaeota archaeon]|nr:hypothetical protein [Nitrososphaerota archaeon]
MKTRLLIIIGIIITSVIVALTIGTTEYQSAYNQNCNSDGGYVVGFLKCIYINEDFSESANQDIIDARDELKELYQINPSLGTFHLKDAVIGYGMGDGYLVVYVLEEYFVHKESYGLIIDTIVDITGGKVDIEFMSSRAGELIPLLYESDVCDKQILAHLTRYSNLFDEEFDGNYLTYNLVLPDGVTQEKFDECIEFILEKKIEESENEN